MTPRSLGVIGTGLIGASIGLRARSLGYRVVGSDARDAAASSALRRGAIDAIGTRAQAFACDRVILAMPVDAIVETLRSAEARGSSAALVVDVGSVKEPIVAAGSGLTNFVATHPLAGRERGGAEAADVALFEDRAWAYVPSGDAALDERAVAFIQEMGAVACAVDARAHDRVVARTSHLPQLLAWLVVPRFSLDVPFAAEALMGPVALELERIARSDRMLWREILAANGANVASEARELARALENAADALQRGEVPV